VRYRVEARAAGMRLDRCLGMLAPSFSRSFWAQVIRRGGVQVAGRRAKPSSVLAEGEELVFRLSDLGRPDLLLDPSELGPPLHEEARVLAYNKPAGLLTFPAGRVVLRSATELAALSRGEPVFPVHRLDKYTSGLLLLARDPGAAEEIGAALRAREVEKTYLCLSRFQPPEDAFEVDLPLGQTRAEHVKLKMLPDPGGKPALTAFRVLERHRAGCLVEARPRTGRQHQIRAHLLHAGAPIVGDLLYGPEEDWSYFDDPDEMKHAVPDGRWHGLHAWRLRAPGWSGEGALELEAPPEGDFAATLEAWREG